MKKITKKLFISSLTAVFALFSLVTSTFAWFTTSDTAVVGSLNASVKGGEGFDMTVVSVAEIDKLVADGMTRPNAVIEAVSDNTWRSGQITSEEVRTAYLQAEWDASLAEGSGAYTTLTNIQFDALTVQTAGTVNGEFKTFAGTTPVAYSEGKYVQFMLVFRSSETGDIYVIDDGAQTATNLSTSGSRTFTIDYGHTLAAQTSESVDVEVTVGDKYNYDISDAARLALIGSDATTLGVSTNTGSISNVFEKDAYSAIAPETATSIGTAGNTKGFNVGTTRGAVEYFFGKRGQTASAAPSAYTTTGLNAITDATIVDSSIRVASTTAVQDDTYCYATVTVYVWIEGWDGECMNGVFGSELVVDMSFKFNPVVRD